MRGLAPFRRPRPAGDPGGSLHRPWARRHPLRRGRVRSLPDDHLRPGLRRPTGDADWQGVSLRRPGLPRVVREVGPGRAGRRPFHLDQRPRASRHGREGGRRPVRGQRPDPRAHERDDRRVRGARRRRDAAVVGQWNTADLDGSADTGAVAAGCVWRPRCWRSSVRSRSAPK